MKVRVPITHGKVDPLDQDYAEVDIPEGWRVVYQGAVKPGDRHLSDSLLKDGIIHWVEVDVSKCMAGEWMSRVYNDARVYPGLIRRGEPVDETCRRCKMYAVRPRHRYCMGCCVAVIKAERSQG